ncbi:MAG: c-type cytochrome [Gammaproteobacteria bacterium]|nr:c-type cytochrome [Gammaproteobacteria bacterium]
MSAHDKKFFDTFMLVIGAMIFVTVLLFFLARQMSGETQEQWKQEDPLIRSAIDERLKPVGRVVKTGDAVPEVAVAAAVEAVPAGRSGEQVFNQACSVCHVAGIAGAPKFGDATAWGDRISKGMDTLVQHATSGFQGTSGYMPPKGGRMDMSDAEIAAAVAYMVEHSQ